MTGVAALDLRTIGHSTRPLPEFLGYLAAHRIRTLADIRRFPASRRNPQYNTTDLKKGLFAAKITYVYLGDELGGFRKARADSPNQGLQDSAFQGYADHLGSALYAAGLGRLLELMRAGRACVMCSESNWKSCHRRILSDDLVLRHGVRVHHIHDAVREIPHVPTPTARLVGGRVEYSSRRLDEFPTATD